MGLIKELDDQIGRLLAFLEESGRLQDTMIVFCSDHGDNMGDHWMGEKDLFYDSSARVPLIVYDPRTQADATRGTASEELIEGIDLTPTFIEYFGGDKKPHIIEGQSLQPLLHSLEKDFRPYCVSEYDYSTRVARREVGVDQADARLAMIFDGRYKYIHVETMRPMLFDLQTDPAEVVDLANDQDHTKTLDRLSQLYFQWTRKHHNRITRSAETIEKMTDNKEPPGILIGYYDEQELYKENKSLPDHL